MQASAIMTPSAVLDALDHIATTPSTNGKLELLKQYGPCPFFCYVLRAALDPFVTYGMADIPAPDKHGALDDFSEAMVMLEEMAERKLTGGAARAMVKSVMESLTLPAAALLRRIITKDLRAGIGDTLVNKAVPGLVPVFDCMLAAPFQSKHVKQWPVAVEPKLDGIRTIVVVDDDNVRIVTRNGKELPSLAHLKPVFRAMADRWLTNRFVLDGEVISGSFNDTASQVRKKDVPALDAVYHVFDYISFHDFMAPNPKGVGQPYWDRRNLVETLLKSAPHASIQLVEVVPAFSVDQVYQCYDHFRERGLEGAIVKDRAAPYFHRRHRAWMKLKNQETIDVPLVGVFGGTGKYAHTIGGIVVDLGNGQTCNVSGLTDQMRHEIDSSFNADPSSMMGRIVEVEFHERTPDGSLRHPRFVRFRNDKS